MGKRGSRFLFGLAGALALAAGAGTANAYFTTFAEAQGGVVIRLGDRTEIEEACSEWTKSIVITSNPDSQPVYIRARAFCGSVYELEYISPSGKWTLNEADGFYYYNDIVYGGASTDVLEIKIGNIPETPEPGQGFNVAVIYESTPVRYHAGGEAYADWTVILDSSTAEDAGAEQSPEEGNTGAAEDAATEGESGAEQSPEEGNTGGAEDAEGESGAEQSPEEGSTGAAEDADAEGESGAEQSPEEGSTGGAEDAGAEQSPEEGNTGAAEDGSADSGAGEGGAE